MGNQKMGHMAVGKLALLTAMLVCFAGGVFAQATNHRDEATEKRNYGDPLPGDSGEAAPERMTIIEAAQSGGVAEARGAFLLGESVNSRTLRGAPALLIAAQSGNISVMRFLLEKGANPDLFEKSTGKTALIAAAQAGESSMVRMLLEHKANPNHQDRQGESALIKAARLGAVDVVRSLLGADLDVNATDYAGQTALWHARDARHERVAQMIEEAGGN